MSEISFPRAFACYNRDEAIRLESTSGGIFTILAEYFICELGGVVFGATFDDRFVVRHVMVDRVDDLDRLRGSKYPQSEIGLCFRSVKKQLELGKFVLFTGTPCQVSGLQRFLSKDYERLYFMDFICHGVASPGVWRGYLSECRNINNIKHIVFKNKLKGWKRWYVKIQYKDHIWYRRGSMEPFMRSYLNYTNVRPSCFMCRFKGLNRNSDFTISDCWGAGERNIHLNDNKGLSALLIQNRRALNIFSAVEYKMVYEEYDPYLLMEGNWTAFRSVVPCEKRSEFFQAYSSFGAKRALKKYYKPHVLDWIKYYFNRCKGKER